MSEDFIAFQEEPAGDVQEDQGGVAADDAGGSGGGAATSAGGAKATPAAAAMETAPPALDMPVAGLGDEQGAAAPARNEGQAQRAVSEATKAKSNSSGTPAAAVVEVHIGGHAAQPDIVTQGGVAVVDAEGDFPAEAAPAPAAEAAGPKDGAAAGAAAAGAAPTTMATAGNAGDPAHEQPAQERPETPDKQAAGGAPGNVAPAGARERKAEVAAPAEPLSAGAAAAADLPPGTAAPGAVPTPDVAIEMLGAATREAAAPATSPVEAERPAAVLPAAEAPPVAAVAMEAAPAVPADPAQACMDASGSGGGAVEGKQEGALLGVPVVGLPLPVFQDTPLPVFEDKPLPVFEDKGEAAAVPASASGDARTQPAAEKAAVHKSSRDPRLAGRQSSRDPRLAHRQPAPTAAAAVPEPAAAAAPAEPAAAAAAGPAQAAAAAAEAVPCKDGPVSEQRSGRSRSREGGQLQHSKEGDSRGHSRREQDSRGQREREQKGLRGGRGDQRNRRAGSPTGIGTESRHPPTARSRAWQEHNPTAFRKLRHPVEAGGPAQPRQFDRAQDRRHDPAAGGRYQQPAAAAQQQGHAGRRRPASRSPERPERPHGGRGREPVHYSRPPFEQGSGGMGAGYGDAGPPGRRFAGPAEPQGPPGYASPRAPPALAAGPPGYGSAPHQQMQSPVGPPLQQMQGGAPGFGGAYGGASPAAAGGRLVQQRDSMGPPIDAYMPAPARMAASAPAPYQQQQVLLPPAMQQQQYGGPQYALAAEPIGPPGFSDGPPAAYRQPQAPSPTAAPLGGALGMMVGGPQYQPQLQQQYPLQQQQQQQMQYQQPYSEDLHYGAPTPAGPVPRYEPEAMAASAPAGGRGSQWGPPADDLPPPGYGYTRSDGRQPPVEAPPFRQQQQQYSQRDDRQVAGSTRRYSPEPRRHAVEPRQDRQVGRDPRERREAREGYPTDRRQQQQPLREPHTERRQQPPPPIEPFPGRRQQQQPPREPFDERRQLSPAAAQALQPQPRYERQQEQGRAGGGGYEDRQRQRGARDRSPLPVVARGAYASGGGSRQPRYDAVDDRREAPPPARDAGYVAQGRGRDGGREDVGRDDRRLGQLPYGQEEQPRYAEPSRQQQGGRYGCDEVAPDPAPVAARDRRRAFEFEREDSAVGYGLAPDAPPMRRVVVHVDAPPYSPHAAGALPGPAGGRYAPDGRAPGGLPIREALVPAGPPASAAPADQQLLWYYVDPKGGIQGPHSISQFRKWLDSLSQRPDMHNDYLAFRSVTVFKQHGGAQVPLSMLLS